ncbi:twin-arginine translocase subunit TatC [Phenylobacterium sp.]|jgi:sec-independent protein translocase protein TatC|uniref:twin-arginine translocase subunit TatC n=1 Tax=Phenylobacterium sp. TaxID=1871053 RepID=UPI002F9576FA
MSDVDHDESEIEASRAPLLDHLIELRKRLVVCVAAIVVGFAICFTFATPIYQTLLYPFEMAARMFAATKGGHGQGPFDLLFVLIGLKDAPPMTGENLRLVFTAPLEFFFTKLKLAAFGAVVLTFPVLAWQVYAFVAPGLYKRERKAFIPFLLAAPLLFLLGAALVYFLILPFVLWFSLSQQIMGTGSVTVELLPKVSDYLTLVTTLLLAFGLCFQLPVVLTLLGLAGMVSSQMLWNGWRYAVFGVVVVAAVVTPPDPISQLMLATPIIGLYFVSIACVKLIERGRKKAEQSTAVVTA